MSNNNGMSSEEAQIFQVIANLSEQMKADAEVINKKSKKKKSNGNGNEQTSSKSQPVSKDNNHANNNNEVKINAGSGNNIKNSASGKPSVGTSESTKAKTKHKQPANPYAGGIPVSQKEIIKQSRQKKTENAEIRVNTTVTEENDNTGNSYQSNAYSDEKKYPTQREISTEPQQNAVPESSVANYAQDMPLQDASNESINAREQGYTAEPTAESVGNTQASPIANKQISRAAHNEVSLPLGAPSRELNDKLEEKLKMLKHQSDNIRKELEEIEAIRGLGIGIEENIEIPATEERSNQFDDQQFFNKKVEKSEYSEAAETESRKSSLPFRKIGKRISKEEAEELQAREQAEGKGAKATLIIHTRTVDPSGKMIENGMSRDFQDNSNHLRNPIPAEEEAPRVSNHSIPASQADASADIYTTSAEHGNARIINMETGEVYEISSPRFAIGKSKDLECVLSERYISRKHALITEDANGYYYVSDIGSTNGTFVNGTKVQPGEKYALNQGDTLKLANVEFQFSVS